MQMIGQTIEARPPFSKAILFFELVAAGLFAWAVIAKTPHPLVAAALPLGIAFAITLGRPQRTTLLIEGDGLRPLGASEKVPYQEIIDVSIGGRNYTEAAMYVPSMPMEIEHSRGVLVLPPVMNVDLADLNRFVVSQAPQRPPQGVPGVLTGFLNEQTAKFGAEKIQVIHTRRYIEERWRKRRRRWIAIGLFLVGLVWILVPALTMASRKNSDAFAIWIFLGAWTIVAGVAVFFTTGSLVQRSADRLLTKNQDSAIIIAPTGIAMVQGDTKGALPWHEITKVHNFGTGWIRSHRGWGLQLHVRGAQIVIFDIYDRPPEEIERLLRRNLDLPAA